MQSAKVRKRMQKHSLLQIILHKSSQELQQTRAGILFKQMQTLLKSQLQQRITRLQTKTKMPSLSKRASLTCKMQLSNKSDSGSKKAKIMLVFYKPIMRASLKANLRRLVTRLR